MTDANTAAVRACTDSSPAFTCAEICAAGAKATVGTGTGRHHTDGRTDTQERVEWRAHRTAPHLALLIHRLRLRVHLRNDAARGRREVRKLCGGFVRYRYLQRSGGGAQLREGRAAHRQQAARGDGRINGGRLGGTARVPARTASPQHVHAEGVRATVQRAGHAGARTSCTTAVPRDTWSEK